MDRRSAAPRSAAKPCGSASRFSSPGLCAGSLPRGAHESFGPCSLLLPPRTGRGATYACAAAALTFAGWSAARPSVSPPGKAVAEVVPPVGSVGVDDRPPAVMSSPIQPKREPYEQKAVLSLLPGTLLRDGTPSLEPMASLPRSSGYDAARSSPSPAAATAAAVAPALAASREALRERQGLLPASLRTLAGVPGRSPLASESATVSNDPLRRRRWCPRSHCPSPLSPPFSGALAERSNTLALSAGGGAAASAPSIRRRRQRRR